MKNNFYKIIALFALAVTCLGSKINAQETREFTVNGIKVILKPSDKEVISARMFIEGGTANYTKEKEGIEAFALNLAVSGGTETLPKSEFNAELDKIGVNLGTASTYDYGSINMTCIKPYWDRSWELFADAILHPAFEEKEFNLLKEQSISNAKQNSSNPDVYLRDLSMGNVFEGKNYAKLPAGSVESITKFTLSDVKNYYKNIIGKERIFLVVAGNVTEADLTAKIQSAFSSLPAGTPAPPEARIYFTEPEANIVDRKIATNYIRGIFSAPLLSDEESPAMQLAMAILHDRFFSELRTKRSLSYAPGAFYSTGAIHNPYDVLYISTTDPKQSLQVMTDIVNEVMEKGFTPEELNNKKNTFLTFHYMDLQTNGSQTQSLGNYEVAGDWKQSEQFQQKVDAVDLNTLNKVFSKYAGVINWTYLGDKNAVKPEDFKQLKKKEENP